MKSLSHPITSWVSAFVRKRHAWVAAAMILTMGALSYGSMIGNSAIVDEVAHIPAAYSYLHYSDYRLNPEHPPLIKDLAALPLQFLNLKFPDTLPAWTEDVNGQWETGWNFLYHIGNDADQILYWSRLPILLLALAFGAVLYWIVWRHWGTGVGLLALFFYCFSPNIIAHSALVTTDLGATVFAFLAIVAFSRYINRPAGWNLVLLSVALAAAQLAKISSILLYVFFGGVALVLVWLLPRPATVWSRFKAYVGGLVGASALSLVWIWIYYATQVAHMPVAVQNKLIEGSLVYNQTAFLADWLQNLNQSAVMQPLVQYLLGVAMVMGRVAGGNVTYLNGQVTSGSFHQYFPELFLVKTQIPFLILMVVVAGWLLWRYFRATPRGLRRVAAHARTHVLQWMLGLFALFYFTVSVAGNLNLGIRHILPIYVPLFILTALGTVKILRSLPKRSRWTSATKSGVTVLLVWYAAATVVAYPNYLSYFNELIGGPKNANKYFSDSSVDWGQDLKRLKTYVADHPEIHKIAVDYFGGGVADYYFCKRTYDAQGRLNATAQGYDCSDSVYEPWHAQNGPYPGQYIAVSETFLENDRYYAAFYNQPGYEYLRAREPIAKVGNSIYVYKLY